MKKIIASFAVVALLIHWVVIPTPVYAATDIVNDATLSTSLLSCWDLNETSGTRVDDDGANDLTDVNTVTSVTGLLGNSASFTAANSEYLTIASASQSPDLSISGSAGDITVGGWIYLQTKPTGGMDILSKYNFANGQREYWLYWNDTNDRFEFRVFNSTTGSNIVTASTFGAPSVDTWYWVMGWVDNTANTVNISINDGTVDSTALTVTTHNGSATFNIGATGASGGFNKMDGYRDVTAVWSKVVSSGERTSLYNSGTGIPCISTGGGSTVKRQSEFFLE